jgi:hypothetical protein
MLALPILWFFNESSFFYKIYRNIFYLFIQRLFPHYQVVVRAFVVLEFHKKSNPPKWVACDVKAKVWEYVKKIC